MPRERLMSEANVWACFSWLDPTSFATSLNPWPFIFNFLVKFVSPSSSMTRISPSQYPDNTRTSCLIVLWALISLRKCTVNAPPQVILPLRSYRETTPVIEKLKGDHHRHLTWRCPNILGPGKVFCHITQETLKRTPIPLGNWVHTCQPGDEIWVKDEQTEPLQPVWTGPHLVILATPTVDKVTGIIPWIHHTRVKEAATSCDGGHLESS